MGASTLNSLCTSCTSLQMMFRARSDHLLQTVMLFTFDFSSRKENMSSRISGISSTLCWVVEPKEDDITSPDAVAALKSHLRTSLNAIRCNRHCNWKEVAAVPSQAVAKSQE